MYQNQILRAQQKDVETIEELTEILKNILIKLRVSKATYSEKSQNYTRFLYYLLTSLNNLQTLGEEYTGIIRVDSSQKALPKCYIQLIWLLFQCYGELIVQKTLKIVQNNVKNNSEIVAEAKNAIIKYTTIFQDCLPLLVKLNKVHFYLNGQFYDVPTWMTQIHFRPIPQASFVQTPSTMFKVLGLFTFIDLGLSLYKNIKKWQETTSYYVMESNEFDSNTSSDQVKCILCLETRKNDTVTQCGHTFCWKCIGDWCNIRPECPICRDRIISSRNILLVNYN